MLARLEREEDLAGLVPAPSGAVEPATLHRRGGGGDNPILFQLADFFDRQGIIEPALLRYRAMQTGADMFSAQVTIGVPANMHIAALRDDFLEFCDHPNLDAIMTR